jgi:WD40 repeat protein
MNSTEVNEFQPYIGPRPFERKDHAFFFGRDHEASELLSLVTAHAVVLLYAQSGAGKTSLLNAKFIPLLEKERFEVLPLARTQGLIPEDIRPDEISNLYIFNTLMSWASDEVDPKRLAQMSLAEFLKTRNHLIDEEGQPLPRVIIFDQFEELFTFYPDRWEDRKGFFDQVYTALEKDRLLRVVFVMREDYIAKLESFSSLLPEKLRTRLHLECLRKEASLLAVTGPLRGTRRSFAEGVAEKLVDDLLKIRIETAPGKLVLITGEFVDPVQLQIVCQSLWQHLQPDVTVITQDHLQAFGDVRLALSEFYEESINRVAQESGIREGDLREWFENVLITPAGTRGTVFRGEDETRGIPNKAVEMLQDLHLIRGEWRAGARWYELTHDCFIEPIQESNKKWLSERSGAVQIRQSLIDRAAGGGLLDEVELREAERWLNSPDAAELGRGEEILALVKTSRRAQAERTRVKRVVLVSAVFVLVIIFFGIGWWSAKRDAERERRQRLESLVQNINILTQRLQDQHSELAALLARHAYLFNQEVYGKSKDQADEVLRRVLSNQYFSHILEGHGEGVTAVAFSPDGYTLVSGSIDKTVRLWDMSHPSNTPLVLRGHEEGVTSVAFSPDGHMLAAGGLEGTVWLWNLSQSNAIIIPLRGHSDVVWSVAFSPDGKRLASGSRDKTVRIWELGQPSASPVVLQEHGDWVWAVVFSPDGRRLASGSADRMVRLWDLGKPRAEPTVLRGHEGAVMSVAFSPDGKKLASGSSDKTVRLWDLTNPGTTKEVLTGHEGAVKSVSFSSDGHMLATGSYDNMVRLWNLSEPSATPIVLNGHGNEVWSVAFSPVRPWLVSGSLDKTVRLWDLGKPIATATPTKLSVQKGYVKSLAFSSDGKKLASGSSKGIVQIWDLSEFRATLTDLESEVGSIAFSPMNRMLAAGVADGTIRLLNLGEQDLSPTILRGNKGKIESVAFSPDGKRLASGSRDKTVRIWEVGQPNAAPVVLEHGNWVWSVAFSTDGKRFASGSADKIVRLWDLNRPQAEPTELRGHEGDVLSVAFSPDGRVLASGSYDKTIRLWDLQHAGKPLDILSGYNDSITSVAFSPDGGMLASGSNDKKVQLWDLHYLPIIAKNTPVFTLGSLLHKPKYPHKAAPVTLTNRKDSITSVAFSPDGKTLASSSKDGTILIEIASTETLADMVCKKVWRNLTLNEWSAFVGADIPYERACLNLPILSTFIQAAKKLLISEDRDGAVALLQRVLKLDPSVELDPERKVKQLEAEILVEKGRLIAKQGKINEAVKDYQKAQKLDPTLKISAGDWNDLCWYGSLYCYAAEVMPFCEQAVALDLSNSNRYRDSRGLARALTKDFKGAIEDFEAFLEWTNKNEEKLQRQVWINALRAGENPFTPELKKELLKE